MHFLETSRLLIKRPSLEYLDETMALDSDPIVMRYFIGGPRSAESSKELLKKAIQQDQKHGFGLGFVFNKENNQFVGRAGLIHLGFDDNNLDIEIVYRLHKIYWGRGYATELSRALIQWGFNNLPVKRLVATINPDNFSSKKVLQKSGLEYIAKYKKEEVIQDMYAIYR